MIQPQRVLGVWLLVAANQLDGQKELVKVPRMTQSLLFAELF